MATKLKVYRGDKHPHTAQKPVAIVKQLLAVAISFSLFLRMERRFEGKAKKFDLSRDKLRDG
jgi:hypothetical protein